MLEALAFGLLLILLPALVVASPQPSGTPTSTTDAPTSISTLCGSIINKQYNIVDAVQAYDCLRSVPFHPEVASQLIRYMNDTIQFHSTLAYLASPPPDYMQPAVDLVAGLAQITRDIDGGNFNSQYDFETALSRLINAAHDDHLKINGGILSTFVYGAPYDIVSLSSDGIELPKLYLANELPASGWEHLNHRPSPIKTINGEEAVEYLTRFASFNSLGKLEPHADWNMLMRSGVLDSQGLLEVFFGGATSYPGETITITLEDGTVIGPDPWLALYLGPPNTGPLQTSGDFYNFFVLGLYPASFQDTSDDFPPMTAASSESMVSPTPEPSTKPTWDAAYPTPEAISPSLSNEEGLPRAFFLNECSIAVLSIPGFSSYGDTIQEFIDTIKAFLQHSKDAGLKKVVLDVQQNKGGQPFLAIEVFKLFFPSIDPFTGSRRRAHPMADDLGNTLTSYWSGLNRNLRGYDHYYTNEWVISTKLNADTGLDFARWDEYFHSPHTYAGDNYTKVERYNISDITFTEEAANIRIDNVDGSRGQPYNSEDIIVLSDGLCSSACALFMELMHYEAGVRTVVVGGRPDYTLMQAPSGTRGSAFYDLRRLDNDLIAARSIENTTGALPLGRTLGFFISRASVNLRDQIRRNDSSNTPLQFRFEAADCRIFFTPNTWYNLTNLWSYAAEAAWHNDTLCVVKRMTNSTSSSHYPTIYEVKAAKNNQLLYQAKEEEGTSEQNHLDDPLNDILDGYERPLEGLEGNPCEKPCECGSGSMLCEDVPVYHGSRSKHQKQCVSYCSEITGYEGTSCPIDYHCRYTGVKLQKWRSSRSTPGLIKSGYCVPDPPSFLPQAKSLVSLSDGDDTITDPCLQNLDNAWLRCFSYSGCFQKCVVLDSNAQSLPFKEIRWCTNSQLKSWQHQKTVESGRDWDTYYGANSKLLGIVRYKYSESQFAKEHPYLYYS